MSQGGGMASTFEVAVVKWDTDAVEPQALEESSIRILKERFKELRHANKVESQGNGSPV